MITYIPNKIIASGKSDWKELMRGTIDQIVQYPDCERPYCDLAAIAPQVERIYNHPKTKEGFIDFTFGNNYLLFHTTAHRKSLEYSILAGKHVGSNLVEIQLMGEIYGPENHNHIYQRVLTTGKTTSNREQELEFNKVHFQMGSNEELCVSGMHEAPDFEKTWSEQIRDWGNGMFW